ncbi:MAG: inorganic phosphate transporter [Planctomycetes bacterium]|nr:inorganic phosphate transporter [Planctomycetota bacterium]
MPDFYVLFVVLVALGFDFINGFHDAANSIATVVSTRVLPPRAAVVWAAFFNFIAAVGTGTLVASTIGKGIVDPSVITPNLIFAALVGAIVWNLITWYYGLPSSSSHALIGGLAGAAIAKAGLGSLLWLTPGPNWLVWKGILGISIYIVVSPLLGFGLGLLFMAVTGRLCWSQRPGVVDTWFRRLQLLSAAVYSYSHGSNDAQKTMGIISALLVASGMGYLTHAAGIQEIPGHLQSGPERSLVLVTKDGNRYPILPSAEAEAKTKGKVDKDVVLVGSLETAADGRQSLKIDDHLAWWIILACHGAISFGTYFGGWRIVKTMGSKITKLAPFGGFCAETGGGVTILLMSHFGIPVSTTHTITGAIVGVGSARRLSAVRWGVAARVVWAWVLTIPAAATVAALTYLPFRIWGS